MNYVDFVPRIYELLSADLSVSAFMADLVGAHAVAYPQYDWAPLQAMSFDESDDLVKHWLTPVFEREPPRAKRVKALWCGLFNPYLADGSTSADMYIGGTKNFVMNEFPREWNTDLEYRPLQRDANSRVLGQMYRRAYDGENAPGNAAELFVGVGYAAKATATLLSRIDTSVVLGARKEVQVAVGWNSGDTFYIGHLAKTGFVPRPAAEALAALANERLRMRAWHEEQDRERQVFRRFRHPDGRRWAINVTEHQLALDFTDTDGDEHSRTHFRRLVAENMFTTADELVREQLANGFVEVEA